MFLINEKHFNKTKKIKSNFQKTRNVLVGAENNNKKQRTFKMRQTLFYEKFFISCRIHAIIMSWLWYKVFLYHPAIYGGRQKINRPWVERLLLEEFNLTMQHCFPLFYNIELNLFLRSTKDMKNEITLVLTSQRRLYFTRLMGF